MRRFFRRGILVGAFVLVPAISTAQTAQENAARRVLLDQAATARAAGDHARALELSERAGRLSMSPSLRMFIAQEQQALGRFAPALGNADSCVRETERDMAVHNRDAILASCRTLLADLRTHVGYITVRVADAHPSDLHVTVGGDTLSDALYGVPYVVTPGDVAIDASGTGVERFHRQVTVPAGRTMEVELALVAAAVTTTNVGTGASHEPTSSGQPDIVASTSSAPPGETIVRPGHHPPPPSAISTIGPFALAGLGAVFVGVGIGFFAARNSAASGCIVTATSIDCPDMAAANRAQVAPTYNALFDISLGVGIVAIAGGVAWFIANRTVSQPANGRNHATFTVTPSSQGLFMTFSRGF